MRIAFKVENESLGIDRIVDGDITELLYDKGFKAYGLGNTFDYPEKFKTLDASSEQVINRIDQLNAHLQATREALFDLRKFVVNEAFKIGKRTPAKVLKENATTRR